MNMLLKRDGRGSHVVMTDRGAVRVPIWIHDLPSFRRWLHSPDFPEFGRFAFLGDDLWMDMNMERFTHNQIKHDIQLVLGALVKAERLGRYCPDGMRLTNVEAGLSTEPDGMFVSTNSFATTRAQLTEGGDSIELIGVPDMVLEVVSPSSIDKDTVILPQLYWQAGIAEYWLVDGRSADSMLQLFRYGRKQYRSVRPNDGWLKSAVFGREFRLVTNAGIAEFALEVR